MLLDSLKQNGKSIFEVTSLKWRLSIMLTFEEKKNAFPWHVRSLFCENTTETQCHTAALKVHKIKTPNLAQYNSGYLNKFTIW